MLYPIDSNGLVINEASHEKTQDAYKPAVSAVLEACKNRLGGNLRSLYIRGSVSVGRAVPGISDLDSVAIVHKEVSNDDRKWLSNVAQIIQRDYPFITFFDITALTLNQISTLPEYSNLKIYLKTQSYCLFGEDVLEKLPSVKPGPDLAVQMYEGLEMECANLRSVIAQGGAGRTYLGESKPLEFWCVWQMRVLLRSGLGLVMMSKPVYSQDLQTCLKVFSESYPDYSTSMGRALEYAINPISDKDELLAFLDGFVPGFIGLWKTSLTKFYEKK